MPSVRANEEFQLAVSKDKSWTFFSDLANVGRCIPGCESVTPINDEGAIFKIKLKVGYLSKTLELRARISEKVAPSHIVFTAEGSDAEISGDLKISEIAPDKTGVSYTIEIRPISITGRTAVTMMGKDLVKQQATEFASCVKVRLESGGT